MKNIFATLLFMALSLSCYAQQKVLINGFSMDVYLDEETKSAELYSKKYKIYDDGKKRTIHWNKKRKFPKMKRNKRTLRIPETITIDSCQYTVTSIGRAAFAGFCNIDSVEIPNTVQNIGDYAFYRTSIVSVEIPENVTFIGKRAFGQCSRLKEIILNNENLALSMTLNKDYYAGSKHCKHIFKGVWYANKGQDNNMQPKESATPIVKSDVDINIPIVEGSNNNTFAFIIANEHYQNVATVNYALHDGVRFKEYCKKVLCIPEDNIFHKEDATYIQLREIVSQMQDIAQAYGNEARFLFYYAGHGIPDEATATSYLLPVDGTGNNIKTGYSLNQLYRILGELPVQNITLFLDACFSGSIRGNGMISEARGVAIKARPETPKGNMVVFAAAQDDQTANPYKEAGHGLFTYFLLKKLQETKGDVTYGELSDYLNNEVYKKSVGKSINKKQIPCTFNSTEIEQIWRTLKLK